VCFSFFLRSTDPGVSLPRFLVGDDLIGLPIASPMMAVISPKLNDSGPQSSLV